MVINITYQPDTDYVDSILVLLSLAMKENLKLLLISYKYPPTSTKEALRNKLINKGVSEDQAEKLINDHAIFRSINPFSYSVSQLTIRELSIIEKLKPDIIVFHGPYIATQEELQGCVEEAVDVIRKSFTTTSLSQ